MLDSNNLFACSFLKLINSVVDVTYSRKKGASWDDPYETGYQPRTTFEGFENQYILILQRGVDPYSPLYTNKYGIGKILGFTNEDDVVVTADGCRNLSEDIPRHPDDIEKWMKQILGR